jgi:hypothetical protein
MLSGDLGAEGLTAFGAHTLRLRSLLSHSSVALAPVVMRSRSRTLQPHKIDVGDMNMSVADNAIAEDRAGIVTQFDVPGNGMQFFGIMIMLLAVAVFPPAWFMIHGDEGTVTTSAFLTWTVMFLSGAVFFGCGKIVTQIWQATTS